MYDTVNFWLDSSSMAEGNTFVTADYLTNVAEHNSQKRGYYISGEIEDYKVCLFPSGISLKGSLSKLALPSNIHTLTRHGAAEAIELLSDHLHAPIHQARVTRLDISTVLPMKQPITDYYSYLGAKRYFDRLQATNNTLYYNTKGQTKQLIFYNKVAEATSKSVVIPKGFEGANLLRYELRYSKRIAPQLKRAQITGTTLTNADFYSDVINHWANEYKGITKLKQISIMDTDEIKTPNQALDVIFGLLLQQAGQDEIAAIMADLRAKNVFNDPKYYTRVKDKIKSLTKATKTAEQNELIKELDRAIFEVQNSAR